MKITLEEGTFDALICDCDGTLVNSAAVYMTALQTVLGRYGLGMEREWYLARTGLAPVALVRAYEEQIAPIPVRSDDFLRLVTDCFRENLHTLKEIPVVADVAREWHGKVPMAVVSNGQRVNVQGSLEIVGLHDLFDTIVTIEDVQRGKPHPDIYVVAAKQLSTAPNRCFVLEDTDEGLQAAQAAGMATLDIRPFLA